MGFENFKNEDSRVALSMDLKNEKKNKNMREIKLRYTWRRKEDWHIWQTITPIECLEGNGDTPFLGNKLWEMIGRDLYTGLKDKNNKEIYEGDIVKGVGEHVGQSEVLFDTNCLSYQPFSYLNDNDGKNYEVIGNIYENPELIKQP